MTEGMTLEKVRLQMAQACTISKPVPIQIVEAWLKSVDAHLSQPAQAVDVGAIREVAQEASVLAAWETVQLSSERLRAWSDKLTRALSGEKAGQP